MAALTDRQLKWFIAHFKHAKNDDICAKLGISTSYLHRLARHYGLKKTKQFMRKTQANAVRFAQIAIANETEEQKEKRRQQARQNRNPERSFKPGEYALANKTPEERAEIHRKKAASWRKTRREDEVRLNWGYPTQTKFRFARLKDPEKNEQVIKYRRYLKTRGYVIEPRSMVFYITPTTRRCKAETEEQIKKLGVIFKFKDNQKTTS